MFQFQGPRNAPLPTLPNVPTGGCVNSEVFSHGTQMSPGVLGHPDLWPDGATPPYWPAVPTNWPRSPPRLVLDWSRPARIVRASPETRVYTPDHSHPPRVQRMTELLSFSRGSSHTYEATKRCV